MQIMTPIFGANLTDEQLVDTFQGLIEATNVETYVQDLAGKLKFSLWSNSFQYRFIRINTRAE